MLSTRLNQRELDRCTIDMFESITHKFQFKFKDRVSAVNILAAAIMDTPNKKEKEKDDGAATGAIIIAATGAIIIAATGAIIIAATRC